MTRHLQLASVLDQIRTDVPDIRAAVLASRDGLAMAATMDAGEASRVAAMAATVHAVSHRVAATAELGDVQETVVRSPAQTFAVYDAGESAVLAVLADGDCNLGLVHLEARRTAGVLSARLTSRVTTPLPPAAPAAPEPTTSVTTATAAASPAASRPSTEPSPNGTGDPAPEPAQG